MRWGRLEEEYFLGERGINILVLVLQSLRYLLDIQEEIMNRQLDI